MKTRSEKTRKKLMRRIIIASALAILLIVVVTFAGVFAPNDPNATNALYISDFV